MNNPPPASSTGLSLQQTTMGPGDPIKLRVRMTDRLLAGAGMAIWSAAVTPRCSPQPTRSATSEGARASGVDTDFLQGVGYEPP